jgi:hypothetical protein
VVEVLVRHEFTYEITDELMRAGMRRFILHQLGWRVPLLCALAVLVLIPICTSDEDHFICGAFVGALALLLTLVVMSWLINRTRAVQMARKLSTRTARVAVSDESLEFDNALARSVIKWALVQKVVRGPDVWLFFLAKQQWFGLPAGKFAGEAGEFLAARVEAAGGKVV